MAITLNGTTGITSPKLDALDIELNSINVVERGSNANGDYVRLADGTQICRGIYEISLNTDAFQAFSLSADCFDIPHISISLYSTSIQNDGPNNTAWWDQGASVFATADTTTQVKILYRGAPSATTGYAYITAVSRWY